MGVGVRGGAGVGVRVAVGVGVAVVLVVGVGVGVGVAVGVGVGGIDPAARHLYVSPSQMIVVVSRTGSYSGESILAQSQPWPVVGWNQTYVWWSDGQEWAAWQPFW